VKKLFEAASAGDLNRVKNLVNEGANVNEQSEYGDTVLHASARSGNKELVE